MGFRDLSGAFGVPVNEAQPGSTPITQDGRFDSGPPGGTLTASADGVITIELIDGVTDYSAIINAALREPGVTEVRLGEGVFTVSSPISLPSDAHLTGAGRDLTTIKANDDFFGGNGSSGVVQSDFRATNLTLADFFIDVNRVLPDNGFGVNLRVNGLYLNQVQGFDVTRVDVANATGYAHFTMGDVGGLINNDPNARVTSGSYTDIRTYNSQVHFEVMAGDGVTYTNVHARDGDGDISTEAYFHPLNGSRNITYTDSSAIGAGFLGFSMISMTRPAENITISNTYVEITRPTSGYGLINHGGLPTINLVIENSAFISHGYVGFSSINTSGTISNSTFQGGVFGMIVDNANDGSPYELVVTDSLALAAVDPNRKIGIVGLDATVGLTWIGGEIEGRGSGGLMGSAAGSATISPETIRTTDGYDSRVGFIGINADALLFPGVPLPAAAFGSFAGGTITAMQRGPWLESDLIKIVSGTGGITLTGIQVRHNGAVIGNFTGGSGDQPLVITLNGAANAAAVLALVQSLAYSSNGQDPGTTARLIEVDITDGAGVTRDLNAAVHMGQILGGFENGVYIVGSSGTQIVEQAGGDIDEVRTFSNFTLPANVDHLTYLGSSSAILRGNDLNNRVTGGVGDDLIDLRDGGNDTAIGGSGNDGFIFGASYTSGDIVHGGAGNLDQLGLQGDYSAGVTMGVLTGVEMLVLLPGNDNRFGGATGTNLSYNITTTNATVAAGQLLTVQANTLRAGENFTFNGAAETDGTFLVFGGLGTDLLTGGSGGDGFFFGQGRFGTGDVVNGGGGIDQVGFQGNFMGPRALVFGENQLQSVEFIVLLSANDPRFGASGGTADYMLYMHNGNVAAGQQLTITANSLRAGERLLLFGLQETDGSYLVYSGAGDDSLAGGALADEFWAGAGDDILYGYGGADILRGGAGNDQFRYAFATDSRATARDQILDFATGDTIDLTELAFNRGLPSFTFIGSSSQSGAGQVQVIQNGNQGTVNIFIDGDAVADLVIDVTIVDGHPLTAADFAGVAAGGAQSGLVAPGKASGGTDGLGMTLFSGEEGGPGVADLNLGGLAPDPAPSATPPLAGALARSDLYDGGPSDPVSLPEIIQIEPRWDHQIDQLRNDFLI